MSPVKWSFIARAYLDLQHLRLACESRLRKMPEDTPQEIRTILEDYHQMLKREEKALLKRITHELKQHPLWKWCEKVKGLGAVACLTFLGFRG